MKRLSAPVEVLDYFVQQSRWHEQFPRDSSATPKDLLVSVCRKFNFTRPFEGDGVRRVFRPDYRDLGDQKYLPDSGNNPSAPCADVSEQAFRRGFEHGFAQARRGFSRGCCVIEMEKEERKLRRWRFSAVQTVGSAPGADEEVELDLDVDLSVAPKMRYEILKRDGFKCQLCGQGSVDDAKLHVDHKKSIFDGGDSTPENLWTLCETCNLGKGRDSL